ncbi:MAG: TIR domain-containing protein, partial [Methylobacterium organophilum]|nr:TIR domain-containing protein [Methylobacterium organophilum]
DQLRARVFAEAFQAQGFKVWWDVGLRTGEAYDEVTEAALRTAKAVVVLWSKKSVASRWVRAEATLADRNKTLVPCMIEPCERPIMFELTQTAELSHWQGDASDKAWAAFLSDVKRFVAKEAASAVAAPTTPLAAPTVEETLKPGQSGSAPSLAVLPFTNRSHLPEDEVFAEGMVEDVTSALSQGVNVRVLGSTATANLSRAAITDLAALGRQLGVRYLLEGNVRRVGANLRVATQLLEAATGEILWTGKFDRPLAELAELQEELVTEIAASLDTQVYALEMERALKKPSDITAWEAVARAWSAYRKYDAATHVDGIAEARRAVAIAPDYAPGHAILASALANAYIAASPDDAAEVQRIRASVERALALAPDDVTVLSLVGFAVCFIGYPEEGERYTGRAVRKAPGSGIAHYIHGIACTMLHRPEDALSHLKTAERLMPAWHMMWAVKLWQSGAYRELGRFAEAETAVDECISLNPTLGSNLVTKACLCLKLGRDAEARGHIETARRLGCDLAVAELYWRRILPNSPRLEDDIATIRALYAATEPGA